MKPVEFIEGLRRTVIDANLEAYQQLFATIKPTKNTIPYWINALKLFNALSDEQKKTLFSIIRQVEVDTVSNILAILDGSTSLEDDQPGNFKLTFNDGNMLNGGLQDIFFELEGD